MLSPYGKREWMTIILVSLLLAGGAVAIGWWPIAVAIGVAAIAILTFFRDPRRIVPTQRSIMVAPSDGKVSSVHEVGYFEPFDGPAICVRILMTVLNVHVNRSPCHGMVGQMLHKPGKFLSAFNPDSPEVNESHLMVLLNPGRRTPVAAVRQVAGSVARRIVCNVTPGDILQRGQRFGMIKFGSTTELYIPLAMSPDVRVRKGARVQGGVSILATVTPLSETARPASATVAVVPDEAVELDEEDPPYLDRDQRIFSAPQTASARSGNGYERDGN